MKKEKRIFALLLAAATMATTALPAWAQTPETADSDLVKVEATWENVLAAREALAKRPATLADDNNVQAMRTVLERVSNAVQNHTETEENVNIKDLQLDKDLVMAILRDLNVQVDGGEAIDTLSCWYSNDLATAIELDYCTAEKVTAIQARLNQLVERTNALCQTDMEKALYVHDWLVQNIAYDVEHLSEFLPDDFNAYGALCEGTAVCEGYAKAYAFTMGRLGIPCVTVTSDDLNHAWNMVQLGGKWYQVDCTWDDPLLCEGTSDQLGYCKHKSLLCSTEKVNANHSDDGDDNIAFDLKNSGTQNIVNLAADDTYEEAWWQSVETAIFPCEDDWYYAWDGYLFWRSDLGDCDSNLVKEETEMVAAGSMAWDGATLVTTQSEPRYKSNWIKQYVLDPATHKVTLQKEENIENYGVATLWDGIYYAASQQQYHQEVRQYTKTEQKPTPTATPAVTPTATPTATPVKPAATPIATPVNPTATPASGYTGWKTVNGKDYWYENGVKQGTTGRGKEIYDPDSDAWYWLDANQGGAKAVSKDVYQESNGGKWVRYDANGHMIKGWDTNDDGTYYFDLVTGAMTKGDVTIDGLPCSFDTVTGIGLNCAWKRINGKDYWYEGGKRQGYDPNNAAYRGKEIYDPASNGWYWLDNVQQGAKAVSKDVYQESSGGKWVRYDANGQMIKGWNTNADGTYYFDPITGAMAKGTTTIDGMTYYFDPATGVKR